MTTSFSKQNPDPYEGLGVPISDMPQSAAPYAGAGTPSQGRDPYEGLGIPIQDATAQYAPAPRSAQPSSIPQQEQPQQEGYFNRHFGFSPSDYLPTLGQAWAARPHLAEWSRDIRSVVGPVADEWFGAEDKRPAQISDADIVARLNARDGDVPTADYDPAKERLRPIADRIADERNRIAGVQGNWDEQHRFNESRNPLQRAAGTLSYVGSQPVRMVTQGDYGLGDLVPFNIGGAGDALNSQERDFERANEAGLHAVGRVAAFQLGAGGGNMGMAGDPKLTRRELDRNAAAVSRDVVDPQSGAGRAAAADAFQNQGVQIYPPALAPTGIAEAARGVENVPFVGKIAQAGKDATEDSFIARRGELAENLSSRASPLSSDEAGNLVQKAVDRYRNTKFQDLPPDMVQELGIDPYLGNVSKPGNYVDIPSAEDFSTADFTPEELKQGHRGYFNLPGSNRTRIQQLADPDLEKIISAPDTASSFPAKQEAYYERASRSLVPIMKKLSDADEAAGKPQTINPMLLATRQSMRALGQLALDESKSRVPSNLFTNPKYGKVFSDLVNPQSNFTLDSIRSLRSAVGEDLGTPGDAAAGLSKKALNQVYAALSDDYSLGLATYATRARNAFNDGRLSSDFMAKAENGMRNFTRADAYTKEVYGNLDALDSVSNAPTVEGASRRVVAALKDKTQNSALVTNLERAMKPGEFQDLMGHVYGELGTDANGNFAWGNVAKQWNGFAKSPVIRAVLERRLGADHLKSMDELARVAQTMEDYNQRKGFSKGIYGLAAAATAHGVINPTTALPTLGVLAGMAGIGRALTSQTFLNNVLLPSYRLQSRAAPLTTLLSRNASALRRELGRPQYFRMLQDAHRAEDGSSDASDQ